MVTTLIATPTPDENDALKSIIRQTFQTLMDRLTPDADPGALATSTLSDLLARTNMQLPHVFFDHWQEKLAELGATRIARIQVETNAVPVAGLVLGRDFETGKEISFSDFSRGGSYLIGGTRTGKSTLMVESALADAARGYSVILFDPHWSAILEFLRRVDENRLKDCLLFSPGEKEQTHVFGMNLFARTNSPIDVDGNRAVDFLDRLWGYKSGNPSWGPNMENLLRACSYLALYNDGIIPVTLSEIPDILLQDAYREALLNNVPDTGAGHFCLRFFKEEYNRLPLPLKRQWASPILNKVNTLLMIQGTLHVVAQVKNSFSFAQLMNSRKIVLVHLSESLLGSAGAVFVGRLLLEELMKAIKLRDPEGTHPYCLVYIDEFENVASSLFVENLPQVAKRNVHFFLTNQFFKQLQPELQGAVQQLPNQHTMRVLPDDAHTRAPLYAKSPTVEYKEQEKKMPVAHPVTWLVNGGRSYESEPVNTFVKEFADIVRESSARITEGQRDTVRTSTSRRGRLTVTENKNSWSNRTSVEQAREFMDEVNSFLYQVMITKNTPRLIAPFVLVRFLCYKKQLPCYDVEALNNWQNPYWHSSSVKYPPRDYVCWFVDRTVPSYSKRSAEEKVLPFLQPSERLQEAYAAIWLAGSQQELTEAFTAYEQGVREVLLQEIMWACEHMREEYEGIVYDADVLEDRPAGKASLRFEEWGLSFLEEVLTNERLLWERRRKWDNPYPGYNGEWRLVAGQETSWLPFINEEIDRIIERCKPSFEELVYEVRAVCDALAVSPILAGTGEYQMVEVRRRAVSDMVNDMQQDIVQLPNHVAYIKLGSSGSESVKIQTLPLEPGCSPEELERRKFACVENTLPYTTPIADVEKQLQERHAAYKKGSNQQEAKPELQPKQDEAEEVQEEAIPEPQREETQQPPLTTGRAVAVTDTSQFSQHPIASTWKNTTGDNYAQILYYLSWASLDQLVRVTGKQSSKNNERAKIAKLVKDGLIVSEPDKDTSSKGRTRLVYSLTTKGYRYLETSIGLQVRKKGNLASDTLLINDVLITAILAAKQNETITLLSLYEEKTFEQTPLALPGGNGVSPDGLTIFRVNGNVYPIWWECDSGSETKNQLTEKIQKILQALTGPYQDRFGVNVVTVVFVVPGGLEKDVERLVGILEGVLEKNRQAAPLFQVGAFNPLDLTPTDLLFKPIFKQPFDTNYHALIESGTSHLSDTPQELPGEPAAIQNNLDGKTAEGAPGSLPSPVSHLSPDLQRKLLEREERQRKHFRSSGADMPLVLEESPLADSSTTITQRPVRKRAVRTPHADTNDPTEPPKRTRRKRKTDS